MHPFGRGRGLGLGRLIARPDTLPGSYPPGQEPSAQTPPAGAPPAQNPADPQSPRHQFRTALMDFYKSVYDKEGDATVADYLGSYANNVWAAPTGMPTTLSSQITGFLGDKPKFNERAGQFLGQYGAKPVPDSALQRLMERYSGNQGFHGGMFPIARAAFSQHYPGGNPNPAPVGGTPPPQQGGNPQQPGNWHGRFPFPGGMGRKLRRRRHGRRDDD